MVSSGVRQHNVYECLAAGNIHVEVSQSTHMTLQEIGEIAGSCFSQGLVHSFTRCFESIERWRGFEFHFTSVATWVELHTGLRTFLCANKLACALKRSSLFSEDSDGCRRRVRKKHHMFASLAMVCPSTRFFDFECPAANFRCAPRQVCLPRPGYNISFPPLPYSMLSCGIYSWQ